MSERSIALFYKQGSSDKVYNAAIDSAPGGFVVKFSYGRRGSTLQTGMKTPKPVALDEATTVFQKLVNEKMGKGYTEGANGVPYVGTPEEPRATSILPQLLNPIAEADAVVYLDDPRFCLQEKFDGMRVLLRKEGWRSDRDQPPWFGCRYCRTGSSRSPINTRYILAGWRGARSALCRV